MAVFDYLNSIAQKYFQFITTPVTVTVPGANFGKVMIFVDEADQSTFFVADPGVDTITEVTSVNYAQVVKGLLKTWLDGFFLGKSVTSVYLVTILDASGTFDPTDAQTQFTKYTERAYFKLAIGPNAAKNIANNVFLARLCLNDPLSQFLYGSNDSTILTNTANNEALQFVGNNLTGLSGTTNGTTSLTSVTGQTPNQGWVGWGIAGVNILAGTTITAVSGTTLTLSQAASGSGTQAFTLNGRYDVPIAYHPSATLNAALVQLGATLAVINSAGVYTGNKLDFLAIAGFSASGTAGANLAAAAAANCATLGVAFYTTAGDGSGNVELEGGVAGRGWTTPLQANIGANWLINYIDTVTAILVAQFMSQPGTFKNNDSYQASLALLTTQLNLFAGIGRLSNLKISAPVFTNLPAASNGVIVVPKAWSASYNDNLRSETVYGTLFLQG